MDLLLGIDVGTTAVKAALFSLNGQVEAVGSAEHPTHYVRPGWVEQNPEDWWHATCQAIRAALAHAPDAARRIAGICVSAQAPTLLPLDRTGTPLRPALIWMDRRAEAEAQQLEQTLGPGEVFRISGNRPDAFYVAAKIAWFRSHEPDLFRQTHQFLQITGYINLRLTGQMSLDDVHATLLQLRDYAKNEWSEALCEAVGVTPSHFPAPRAGHEVLGEVTREAAGATGLRPGTPVMVGTVDGAAAAVEAGAVDPGAAAEMTGTSTVLLMPAQDRATQPAFIAMPHAVPDVYLLLGAMVASGASLRWFRDQFGQPEVEAAARQNQDAFDLLVDQAAQIAPGSGGVIFLPYMMGERAPIWNTHARGVFFGLSLATPRAALIRAVLEGTAFALRHNIEVAREAGVPLTEIHSVGGGTRSALWNQIKADVTGLPILLPATSVGAPFGDAVLAGFGLGLYPDISLALRQLVQLKTRYEPDLRRHAHYGAVYPIFRSIYDNLRDTFDRAARLPSD